MRCSALELRFPPPIIFAVSLLLIGLINWWFPSFRTASTLMSVVSGICFLASGIIGLSSLAMFYRQKTTVNPVKVNSATTLVDSGLYAFSRNPMYLALALLLLSICLWLGNLLSLAGVVLFIGFITRFQIIPEERALAEIFGENYQRYCQRVRRWL
ncbi:isoprenylcysteine carboxylmethyltransferase family protein [Budviciaceae bacterium BWR-B9]|uniref:Isoprenylcysteine carboxylmethyltransferase family protein n=1 Tax=Limnobaculum allomyrinae TaxID=2791986 RepID=A0ABS1IU90_9GAMM|nr:MULTISPECIES: isoprenylcysteine carboxylmethyltransferase family protein [Limnobaculum]MBK5145318.1 isoprenylcysteine carboxylmethyltransferase family protein [Limnobaculum allomyrinae]MBV7693254.1 isoprenylcysteine carboxylmethyltransferase family protein [Limnobaculum sp. M2-1]